MSEFIITSSVLIAIVIVLRFLFRGKISRRLQYTLWGLVLLRLLMPFSLFESPLSIMNAIPESLPVSEQSVNETAGITGSITGIAQNADSSGYLILPENANITQAAEIMSINEILLLIWLIGTIAVGLWIIGTNFIFYRRLNKTRKAYSVPDFKLPVYVSESIASPCLFGIFYPAVYLTPKSAEDKNSTRYVLSHELCHYCHGDHIWSILRSICLAAYWWNPLVWVAAFLSSTDSEMACDEAVIKQIGEENRLAYGYTLIDMIAVRKAPSGIIYAATTMASGKRGIKTRLNMIIKNHKTFIPAMAAVLLIILISAGCTFTGAQQSHGPNDNGADVSYAQKLYESRNQYIGNASGDSSLLEAIGVSEKLGSYKIELETKNEPYVLRIIFTDKVTDAAVLDSAMNKYAMLLLALIDNASEIQWQYSVDQSTGGNGSFTGSLNVDEASLSLGNDIKSFAQSADQVQSLLDWLDFDRSNLDACVSAAILSEHADGYKNGDFATEAHTVLKTVESDNTATVYAMVLYQKYNYDNGWFSETGGGHMPVAITFEKNIKGEYDLKEYWIPKDGTYYAPSIKEKFPSDISLNTLNTQKYILAHKQKCYAQAIEYGKLNTDSYLAGLIETICSSPAQASNPNAYIDAHPIEYRELMYCGDYTLRYAYSEFLKGGQTALQGHILLSAMRKLLGGEDLSLAFAGTGTAQEWFDEWKDHSVSLRDANSMEFMEKNYPKTAILLHIIDKNIS